MINLKSRYAEGIALAILLTLPACTRSKQRQAPVRGTGVAVETAEIDKGGPALWQLTDEDTTIYLFGTVHVLPEDVVWYKGVIAKALGSSDRLITEVMLTQEAETQSQQLVMSKGLLPTGTSLRSLLDEHQKTTYETAMARLGVSAAAFDQFEPWVASINLAMLPLLQQGYDPNTGVEKVLEAKAGPDMARGELETIEFQISVFDELPMESQIKFLVETAANVDSMKTTFDALVVEWGEGDVESVGKLINLSLTDPVIAERLLYARNRNWAEWIAGRMDAPGTIFIAVGAGHLAGDKSVQHMLKTRGFTVTRVQ